MIHYLSVTQNGALYFDLPLGDDLWPFHDSIILQLACSYMGKGTNITGTPRTEETIERKVIRYFWVTLKVT